MLGVLGVMAELLGAACEGAARVVRAAAVDAAEARDLRRLRREVNELNARVAALEPRGEAVAVCAVCGGPLHAVKLDVVMAPVIGPTFRRDILRCGRCWALRPVDRADGTGEGDAPAAEAGR